MTDVPLDKSSQFEEAVVDSFKVLEVKYGFERRVSRPDRNTLLIRYETPSLYVALSYGPPAYEAEMAFGRRGVDDVPGAYSFEAGDLIQLDDCNNWQCNKNYPTPLVGLVAEFARLLAGCGSECLAGNPKIFNQMKDRRNKLIAEWKRDERTKGVRSKIATAWSAKDYKGVVDLYSLIDDLSELDKKRLHFAKAHA